MSAETKVISDPFGLLGARGQTLLKEFLGAGENRDESKIPVQGPPKTRKCRGLRQMDDSEEVEAAPAAGAGGAPVDSNECAHCGGKLLVAALENRCESCGIIEENDSTQFEVFDEEAPPKKAPVTGRIRVVGPSSGRYQPDMDRSSGTSAESNKMNLYHEFVRYNQKHVERGNRSYPSNVLREAAEMMHDISKAATHRAQNKRVLMASSLETACMTLGRFAADPKDLADMFQLKTRGTARGGNYIRMLVSDNKTDFDVDADVYGAHVNTVFGELKLDGKDHQHLRDAVTAIVHRAVERNVGISSVIRSKVLAATHFVVERSKHAEILKKSDLFRKNTIEKFLGEMKQHKSLFADIYLKYGIDPGKPKKTT